MWSTYDLWSSYRAHQTAGRKRPWVVISYHVLRTLAVIWVHPTLLATRTKESNMCASLRVLETQRQNESEDGFGRCRRRDSDSCSRTHRWPTYSTLRKVWVHLEVLTNNELLPLAALPCSQVVCLDLPSLALSTSSPSTLVSVYLTSKYQRRLSKVRTLQA